MYTPQLTNTMPEGPECHNAALKLERVCKGKLITSVEIHGGRYKKHGPFEGFEKMQVHIREKGSTVKAVGSRGKLIVMFFDNDWCLLCTLGLKGGWTSKKADHCDVSIDVDCKRRIWFKDQIHYGTLRYVDLAEATNKMKALGPDVTVRDQAFTEDYLDKLMTRYATWDVSKLLMDQSKMSGIGNYLKAEILYKAKIAPNRLCETITADEKSELFDAIMTIPSAYWMSYTGGPTIQIQVYNRKKDKLGHAVEKCKTKDGRTSHWVPAIQR